MDIKWISFMQFVSEYSIFPKMEAWNHEWFCKISDFRFFTYFTMERNKL